MSEESKTIVFFLQRIVEELENISDAIEDGNIIMDNFREAYMDNC